MATSFSGGRSRREPPTMGKQPLALWVECTLFVIHKGESRAQTHTVLVIGLYELLGNPTTYLIEPPCLVGIDL